MLMDLPELSGRSIGWAWLRTLLFIAALVPSVVAGFMFALDDSDERYYNDYSDHHKTGSTMGE